MTQLEDSAASGSGPPPEGAADAREEIRAYWDVDATTYDLSPHHRPRSSAEQAAWAATLARVLPPAPARVLDVGAGTGFLSMLAAGLGHDVTAHDLSPGMLARLAEKAEAAGLEVTISEGAAEEPPAGPFDAVIERHLLWTLRDPEGTLAAWRRVAPSGRLVVFEGLWGAGGGAGEAFRSRLRQRVRRLRREPPDHHGSYDPSVREQLPLGTGTPPEAVVELVEAAGWPGVRLERLADVEWATRRSLPWPERSLGVTPRFLVAAG